MRVGQLKKLSLTGPHTETVIFNNNESGDVVTDELYLELQDDCNVTAVGYALKGSNGVPIKFVDMANLNVPDEVSSAGIYLLMTSSLEKVEITFDAPASLDQTPTVRAIIKTVYGG